MVCFFTSFDPPGLNVFLGTNRSFSPRRRRHLSCTSGSMTTKLWARTRRLVMVVWISGPTSSAMPFRQTRFWCSSPRVALFACDSSLIPPSIPWRHPPAAKRDMRCRGRFLPLRLPASACAASVRTTTASLSRAAEQPRNRVLFFLTLSTCTCFNYCLGFVQLQKTSGCVSTCLGRYLDLLLFFLREWTAVTSFLFCFRTL